MLGKGMALKLLNLQLLSNLIYNSLSKILRPVRLLLKIKGCHHNQKDIQVYNCGKNV